MVDLKQTKLSGEIVSGTKLSQQNSESNLSEHGPGITSDPNRCVVLHSTLKGLKDNYQQIEQKIVAETMNHRAG